VSISGARSSILNAKEQILAICERFDLDPKELPRPRSDENVHVLGEIHWVRPHEIHFTHNQISPKFRNGTALDKAIRDILAGTMSFHSLPPILCVEVEGKWFSLNNRRLYVARVLASQLENFFIQIDLVEFMHPKVQQVKDGRSKWDRAFSTKDGGFTVQVKSKFSGLELPQLCWEIPKEEDEEDRDEEEWWEEYLGSSIYDWDGIGYCFDKGLDTL